MRHILFLVILATTATLAAVGNSASMNPAARFLSVAGHLDLPAKESARHLPKKAGENTPTYIPLILRVETEGTPLPPFATELHRRGTIVLASVPQDRIAELASVSGIHRLEAYCSAGPTMASAREFCRLPEAVSYDPHPDPATALDGTGVVVGFTDIGFDPNHLNFLDGNGNTRVRKLVNFTLDSPLPTILDTPEEIKGWTTDSDDDTHATHVAGILSGSYTADRMQGVAPGAEIVATTSPLYDASILAGCEEIIGYARMHDKPAVINISISSDIGPHDGTTLFNQYMESITEEATVCISAANDGARSGFASGTTSADTPSVRTYFREFPHLSPLRLNGTVDIWSDNDRPFAVTLLTQDMQTGEIQRIPVPLDPEKGVNEWILCSREIQESFGGDIPSAEMPEYMDGYIYVACELNPENHRYNVSFRCSYIDTTTTDPYKAHILFGAEAEPTHPGTTIEFYSTPAIFFTKYKDAASLATTPARTVNDFCAGDGPMCVGSMDSQNHFTSLSGTPIDFPRLTIGGVSYFSSYGTLATGKVLPDVCAPGAQVVSSLSRYYCQRHPDYPLSLATISHENDGTTHCWGPMQGTSMSSPFAAGVAALWLQANPGLTGKEIRDIALATAASPATDAANPQWGHGVLDAAAGLEMARRLAGMESVPSVAETALSAIVRGNTVYMSLPAAEIAAFSIVSPDGRMLSEQHPGSAEATADCTGYPAGVYIISATDSLGQRHSAKVVLR